MKKINHDAKAPTFTLSDGTTLELARVRNVKLAKWWQIYMKNNPQPQPPRITLSNGDEEFNIASEGYVTLKNSYDLAASMASNDFFLEQGVVTNPPPDFVLDPSMGTSAKLAWLYSIVEDEAELSELIEAIATLETATKRAVEDAEKNSD
jgi:hypothetical protein